MALGVCPEIRERQGRTDVEGGRASTLRRCRLGPHPQDQSQYIRRNEKPAGANGGFRFVAETCNQIIDIRGKLRQYSVYRIPFPEHEERLLVVDPGINGHES